MVNLVKERESEEKGEKKREKEREGKWKEEKDKRKKKKVYPKHKDARLSLLKNDMIP